MPTPPPTARSMTKTEAAFHTLRTAIEEGRFKPGEHLTLSRLLEELDMSPTPIREAMRLLQAEGLVEHQPHHGVVVATYLPEKAEEIYRLRVVLEPLATELAVERATPEQVAHMRALHEELDRAVREGSPRTDVAELNAQWHRAVYAASESRHLQEFITRLWTAIPVRAIWLTRRGPTSTAQHAEIMAAIESGDAASAAELMRRHIAFGAESTADRLRTIGTA
jgi:DNA-binding GntR family transcriptional regulator